MFNKYDLNLVKILNKNMKRYGPYKEDIYKRGVRIPYINQKEFISEINTPLRTPVWKYGGDFHGKVPDYVEENERRRGYAIKIYGYFKEKYEKEVDNKKVD